jgi:hypothetical protein
MDQRADCSSRPAATAMAAPAERRSPRAHRSYPQISRLSCVTGSWWRSQPCLQRTGLRTGRRRRWWPKISSPPPTPGCWRLLSNCDCPRSCRPNRSGSSVSSGSQGPSSFAGDDTIRTSPGPDDVGNASARRQQHATGSRSPPLSRQGAPSPPSGLNPSPVQNSGPERSHCPCLTPARTKLPPWLRRANIWLKVTSP